MAQCVKSAGTGYPIIEVTGFGTPDQMRRSIKDGVVTPFVLWNPYNEGYLAGYLGLDILKGEIRVAEGNMFTVPNLGERVVKKNNVVVTQGQPTVFDKGNIDDCHF